MKADEASKSKVTGILTITLVITITTVNGRHCYRDDEIRKYKVQVTWSGMTTGYLIFTSASERNKEDQLFLWAREDNTGYTTHIQLGQRERV